MDQLPQEQLKEILPARERLIKVMSVLRQWHPDLDDELVASAMAFDELAKKGLTEPNLEELETLITLKLKTMASLATHWINRIVNEPEWFIEHDLIKNSECSAQWYADLFNEVYEFMIHHERMKSFRKNLGLVDNEEAPLTEAPFTDLFVIIAASRCGEYLVMDEQIQNKNPDLYRATIGSSIFGCFAAWHISRNYPEESKKLFDQAIEDGLLDSIKEEGLDVEVLEEGIHILKPFH